MKQQTICFHKNRQERFRYGNVPIYQCQACDLIFTLPKQKRSNVKLLYQNYYKNEIPARFRFGLEYIVRLFRFFRAYKLYTIYPKAKSILDIGSGRGFTLYYLKKYYHYKEAVGTQLNKTAVEFSRKKLGLTIYYKDLLNIDFGKEKFDLITMWHVLEHVTRPEEYIRKIKMLLSRKGKIVIEVPNFNSWTRNLTGKYWLGLDPEYHLTFFTPKTISRLLKKYQFKIIQIHTFSLEYSTFISVQSLVSRITKTDQLFFKWLQTKVQNISLISHVLLFILITPISLLINLPSYFGKWGEVLLVVAEKKD